MPFKHHHMDGYGANQPSRKSEMYMTSCLNRPLNYFPLIPLFIVHLKP